MPNEKSFLEKQVAYLSERIEKLEEILREQITRIYKLEESTKMSKPKVTTLPEIPSRKPPEVKKPPAPKVPPSAEEKAERARRRLGLEAKIGGHWLNRIGALAIVVGVAFFLKYAFENRWIGEAGRIMLGILAGLGLIGGGEHFQRKKYPIYAQGLSGAGIAILYFSIFAAFNFYHLIGYYPAFGFMILVTITAILLAVRYDALSVTILGILGGFLTPVLLRTPAGVSNPVTLFSYIALLNLGILGVAYFKNWRVLNILSFWATVLTFIGWYDQFYDKTKLPVTLLFLTIFFFIFAFLSCFYSLIHRKKVTSGDLSLILTNPALYFGASYGLLHPEYHDYLGLFAIVMAAVYLGLGHLANLRNKEDKYLTLSFLGIALTFLTLAIPIQLKQHWITIAWAIEATILVWIGFQVASPKTRIAALVILGFVAFRLLTLDTFSISHKEFTLVFNKRFFAFLVGIGSIFTTAYLYFKNQKKVKPFEKGMITFLILSANFLIIWLFSAETIDYFNFKARALKYSDPLYRNLQNAKQLSLSAVWAIYSIILVTLGIIKKYQPVRLLAIILFGITILKVFFFDLSFLERIYRIISFIGLGVILLIVSFMYQRFRSRITEFVLGEEKAPSKEVVK